MDKIIIEDLEVYAYHGVASEEKTLGQMFLISVEMDTDLIAAGHSDDISDTIHYGHVCNDIEDIVAGHSYNLIEALAQDIADRLLQHYPKIQNIKVIVKKPWAPIRSHVKYVAVEIERAR
ncbi:MAG: 7,8-dihydroneopterin aldolase/epimerase/oxygenase [Clostridiales bacterium]|nr:7,8-dihydroneopterin aldolase/epimerase/oxygenase [Clostridiales bacterium]